MLEFVVLSIGAFVLALLAIAAIVIVAGGVFKWPGRAFDSLMYMILAGSLGTTLLTQRVLRFGDEGLTIAFEGDVAGGVLSKLLLIAVVGCGFAMCIAWPIAWLNRVRDTPPFPRRAQVPPTDFVVSFMVYFVAFSILPIFFGTSDYFHVFLVYPLFVFLALLLWVQVSSIDPVRIVKRCLNIIVLVSLLGAILAPQLTLQPGYVGLIPGFSVRLWGLTAHANTLGSVAFTLIVLEVAEPTHGRWLRYTSLVGAIVALVLTKSKAALLSTIVALSLLYGWRRLAKIRAELRQGKPHGHLLSISLIGVVCSSVAVIAAWMMFSESSIVTSIERKLDARAVSDLGTATGRLWVWEAALRGGMESPIFGQGADYWKLENQLRFGLHAANHAHNLYLQAFSVAGMTGLFALLVFLYFLVVYSIRAAKVTRGGSIALMIAFLTRAMVEVPIAPNGILGAEFFATMAYFIYAMDRGAKRVAHKPKWARAAFATTGIRAVTK